MLRLSKFPEEYRPEIISDISDDKLYTLVVQTLYFMKIGRLSLNVNTSDAANARRVIENLPISIRLKLPDDIWEGHYSYFKTYKNIIDKNIPCVLMHKVKNKLCPEIDTVVCFMTGNTQDVFLVHPKDLIEWNPDEEIKNV